MASSSWIRCRTWYQYSLGVIVAASFGVRSATKFFGKNNADVGHAQSHHAGTSEDQSWPK